jgi:hypothetical protein
MSNLNIIQNFETSQLNLKDRFKPLYYELFLASGDKNYAKCRYT